MRLEHEFPPVFNTEAKVLILGSFPSVQSREQQFYYGHPQNRFWRLMAALCGEATPQTVEQKKALCLMHGVALWDVIESCEIEGSSDSSIREVTVNDLTPILTILALITINIGIFNLLPIPALDGGRLFFLVIEGIFRKPSCLPPVLPMPHGILTV